MVKTYINIPTKIYNKIQNHLIPNKVNLEHSAFIFAKFKKTAKLCNFYFVDWYPVKAFEYKYQSLYHIELKDNVRAKIDQRQLKIHRIASSKDVTKNI